MKLWTLALVLIFTGVQAEPVQDFEKLVKRCQGIFDARPVVEVAFVPANKLWVKRIRSPVKLSYDVRKTDSLVSPLIAYIEAIEITAVENAANEELAQALNEAADGKGVMTVNRINFAIQGGIWVLTGGSNKSSYRRTAGGPFVGGGGAIDLSREKVPGGTGGLGKCAGLP